MTTECIATSRFQLASQPCIVWEAVARGHPVSRSLFRYVVKNLLFLGEYDAAAAVIAPCPVVGSHAGNLHYFVGGGRVDETVVAQIDADVGEGAFESIKKKRFP